MKTTSPKTWTEYSKAKRYDSFARNSTVAIRWLTSAVVIGFLGFMAVIFTMEVSAPTWIGQDAWMTVRRVMFFACPALFGLGIVGFLIGLGVEDEENKRLSRQESLPEQ